MGEGREVGEKREEGRERREGDRKEGNLKTRNCKGGISAGVREGESLTWK